MKLEWTKAPTKTQWGHDMVEACIAIDKDHTLSLYCERDQAAKVHKVLKPKWKGLTKQQIAYIKEEQHMKWLNVEEVILTVQSMLKEKNR